MTSYFDARVDLLLGRAAVLLPHRQAAQGDGVGRSEAQAPRLAAQDAPPPFALETPRDRHETSAL